MRRLIRSELDRCQSILDSMSGRAGAGLPPTLEPMTPSAIAHLVQERLTTTRRQRLTIDIEPATPNPAATGAEMVQAISSLLRNAFDASGDADGVALRFGIRGAMVRVEVQDRGAGMSPDARRRAGEPFYTTKEPGRGLGLGLFLVRTFAERSGGSLEFQGTEGTTAILEVPGSGERGAAADMTDGRSLLIVDDDTAFRERLVRAMRDRGYEASGVADHPAAIDAAREDSPELALVDLRLPGESGLSVVRDLKALDSSTVVVVLTGYGSIATAVESMKLGAASYLTKPANADQIVAAFDGTQPSDDAASPVARAR